MQLWRSSSPTICHWQAGVPGKLVKSSPRWKNREPEGHWWKLSVQKSQGLWCPGTRKGRHPPQGERGKFALPQPFWSIQAFYSDQMMSTYTGKGDLFTQFPKSNANPLKKHFHRHTHRKNVVLGIWITQ